MAQFGLFGVKIESDKVHIHVYLFHIVTHFPFSDSEHSSSSGKSSKIVFGIVYEALVHHILFKFHYLSCFFQSYSLLREIGWGESYVIFTNIILWPCIYFSLSQTSSYSIILSLLIWTVTILMSVIANFLNLSVSNNFNSTYDGLCTNLLPFVWIRFLTSSKTLSKCSLLNKILFFLQSIHFSSVLKTCWLFA